eukprot:5540888-Amphidinium_carterae.3
MKNVDVLEVGDNGAMALAMSEVGDRWSIGSDPATVEMSHHRRDEKEYDAKNFRVGILQPIRNLVRAVTKYVTSTTSYVMILSQPCQGHNCLTKNVIQEVEDSGIREYTFSCFSHHGMRQMDTNLPYRLATFPRQQGTASENRYLIFLNLLKESIKAATEFEKEDYWPASLQQELLIEDLFPDLTLTAQDVNSILRWKDVMSTKNHVTLLSTSCITVRLDVGKTKTLMRQIDSLRTGCEYHLNMVKGFQSIKALCLNVRKRYLPRVTFSSCAVYRWTYGNSSPLSELDETGWVIYWKKNAHPGPMIQIR